MCQWNITYITYRKVPQSKLIPNTGCVIESDDFTNVMNSKFARFTEAPCTMAQW